MTDLAKVMGIRQKRADVLNNMCFSTIAKLQDNSEVNQIEKAVKILFESVKTEEERFYVGIIFGRIIQNDAIAQDGAEKFVAHHWRELEKAKAKLSEHPEFG